MITGPRPTLYECFNQSDMLISDISSVVSDFIATGKPYMVTNPVGLTDDDFRAKFPSAAAAYLIGPDCARLADIGALAAGSLIGVEHRTAIVVLTVVALVLDNVDGRVARRTGTSSGVTLNRRSVASTICPVP